MYLTFLCHYLLTAAVSIFVGHVHKRGFILFSFYQIKVNMVLELKEVKYNPL